MTKQTKPYLLEVENLAISIDSSPTVRGISFALREGEILGLVGESGSGKSLTCRALLGLLPESARVSGRVNFAGRDLLSLSTEAMRSIRGREIAMIFQNPASHLDPLMSLGCQIAEPLRQHFQQNRKQARENAIEALRSVQIQDAEHRVDTYPHELSGGMKQRGMIAGAMACRPRLLLADEPTTALDVTVQARILDLLRELNRRDGLSIIFVSHDLAVIAELCDRVLVMRNGEFIEHGPTQQIMRAPTHSYTQLLIDSQPSSLELPQLDDTGEARTPLIELDDLSITYTTSGLLPGSHCQVVRALENASLTVEAGESLGIVGESGSGKSTIARAIMRLVVPAAGTVRFQGKDIAALRGAELQQYRRKVQMVFQNPFDSLNPRMRVVDTIAEPMIRHGLASRKEALERARELMRQVELPVEFADRRPHQLSGGQCQRVGIARALALDPEVLIADEVTSALDVTIQAQILRLIQRLRAERKLTVIYISHDLAVVRRFCDRIAVFRHARLIELGSAEQVLEHPRDDYTKLLIGSAPSLERALEHRGAFDERYA
ncbi:dipeptide ABC transporter ATP-binding protein [Pseudomonas fluorescens]|uniref:dipeptide ABC transporter ATP-binding protein n=1 Tax=Pseudomonas fluorescens TaxID=294 RepID=UPI003C245E2E